MTVALAVAVAFVLGAYWLALRRAVARDAGKVRRTDFEMAMDRFTAAMIEMQREIGTALLPAVEEASRSIKEFARMLAEVPSP